MIRLKKTLAASLIGLVAWLGSTAYADEPGEPIGYVMTVKGEATVITRGQALPASVGQAIMLGAELVTGPDGALGVTLTDSTVMSFGPNTQLTVDEYLYTPAQEELRLSARISRGTLNFISGVIAKLKPEAVQIQTPTGTIGVRGTHFLVKVDG